MDDPRAALAAGIPNWSSPPRGSTELDMPPLVPSEENPVAGWTNIPRERSGTRGEDEAGRRRRRREAMVLREGDGGAVEDDIIRFHGYG